MPRNRLIVPIVITIDERFRRVTNSPFTSPHNKPTLSPTATSAGVGKPACAQKPMMVELSAIVDATDKSISRAMISIAIGSTMMAFSVKLKVASKIFQILRKWGEARAPATNTSSVTSSKKPSQHIRRRIKGVTVRDELSFTGVRDVKLLFMIWPLILVAQREAMEHGVKLVVLSVYSRVR